MYYHITTASLEKKSKLVRTIKASTECILFKDFPEEDRWRQHSCKL